MNRIFDLKDLPLPSADAGVPLYRAISDILSRHFENAECSKGQMLPSLEALALHFGVNRLTVRQALKRLEYFGLVKSHRGKGFVVEVDFVRPSLMRLQTDWQTHLDFTGNTHVQILSCEIVGEYKGELSFGNRADCYVKMERIHSKAGAPYAYIIMYLDQDVYNLSPQEFHRETALSLINRYLFSRLDKATQEVAIDEASPAIANCLGIGIGKPIAKVKRAIYDQDARAIYISHIHYPGQHVLINIDIDIKAGESRDD